MGRAVHPGRFHEVLAAEEQAGGLRPAQALAAAVGHERRAVLQVDVGHGQDLGRGVDEHRHVPGLGHGGDGLRVEGALVGFGAGQDVHERGLRAEGRVQLRGCRHLDDPDADRAQRRVVDVARVLGDDDLVSGEAGQVGDADVQIGVAARDARRRRVRERGGAADGDQAPFGLGQLRQTGADGLGQLVQVHVVLGGRGHGLPHLGQHRRSTEDRVRAPCVDEGPHPDRLVDVGADAQAGSGRRGRRGSGRGRGFVPPGAGHGQETSRETAASEQLAAGDSFSAHRAPPRHFCGRATSGDASSSTPRTPSPAPGSAPGRCRGRDTWCR